MNALASFARRMPPAVSGITLALGILLARFEALAAQEMAVPVGTQVPLLVKILAFDRSLAARVGAGNQVGFGVLYQGNYRASADVADQVQNAANGTKSNGGDGIQLRVVLIDLDETRDLADALAHHGVRVLYVGPLRAVDLKAVSAVCRQAGVTTVTGVPSYVEAGLAIGLDLKGQRPEIVVNLAASRAEGADLDAQLLKLARIVR